MAAPTDVAFSFYSNRNKAPGNKIGTLGATTPELFRPRRSTRFKSPISPQENAECSPNAVLDDRRQSPLGTPKDLSQRLERIALKDCTNKDARRSPRRRPLKQLDGNAANPHKPWVEHPDVEWEEIVRDVAPEKIRRKIPTGDDDTWRQMVDQFELDELYSLCRRANIWQLVPMQEVKTVHCIDQDGAKFGAFASVCPVAVDGQVYVAKLCVLDPDHNPALDVIEEFRTMVHIPHHSNVVRASFLAFDYSPGGQHRRALMLLERCNGALQDLMNPAFKVALQGKGLYNDFIARVAYGSAKGMAYLQHKCGLLHCDIKEGNILMKWPKIFTGHQFMARLVEDPVLMQLMDVKIADFGLSLHVEEDGTFPYFANRGTHGYIAPECVDEEEVLQLLDKRLQKKVKALAAEEQLTSKADVFSWGVAMWHLTDFKLPDSVKAVNDLVQQSQQDTTKKGRNSSALQGLKAKAQAEMLQTSQSCRLDPDLHAEVAALIEKSLSLDPDMRPSWQQIQATLQRHVPM